MSPITHFLFGWTLSLPTELEGRDRALVALAAVSPDIDALPAVVDLVQGRSLDALELGSLFHHQLHTLAFALVVAFACALLARRKSVTGWLAFASVNLHYACDIAGSRGPDGYQWPIPYLMPFSSSWRLTVPWQWRLNAWPNLLISIVLMALTIYFAWRRGYSPVELVSRRADRVFVDVLRGRFGEPGGPCPRR